MKISSRTKEILNILCNRKEYVTVKSIAREIGVSSRTILRELSKVENWLQENGYDLNKKKGTGIGLDCTDQEKDAIKNLLQLESVEDYYMPEERRFIILSELLRKQEPVKLYSFTVLTNVSEATISNDLDEIEKWLKSYKLKLIRKPGLGVYLKGSEKDIRQASINLLYENIDQKEIFRLIQQKDYTGNKSDRDYFSKNRLLGLISSDTINMLGEFIQKVEDNIGYQLADDSYVALLVHLAIALERISSGEKIIIDSDLLEQLKQTNEYIIASGLFRAISKAFSLDMPDAEIAYVAMHLRGIKGRGAFYNSDISMTEDFRLVKLTRKIIETAEINLGIYLEDDEKLLVGLVRHLEPTINRIKLGLDIRNPFIEEIKKHYSKLYNASRVCASIIEECEKIKVPESEIAFIAMHLGAAVERKRKKPVSKYRITVACTSGIGASRLLASRINKEFENIEIVDLISTIDFDEESLRKINIDFIVSTVPITASKIPVIIVNPLLTDKHQQKIEDFIETHQARQKRRYQVKKNKLNLKDKLAIINNYNQSILELLDNLRLINNYQFRNVNHLITDVSKILVSSNDQKMIQEDLKNREEKGSTILEHNHIMLLHCRSKAMDELNLLVLLPEKPFKIRKETASQIEIKVVVVMAAPLDCSSQGLEVLSEISKLLIENERFLQAIHSGNEEEIYFELDNYFDHFYQQKCKMKYQKEGF
ncbi:PRD domain-containing protein [Halocella sp. SP3-1]|uniref:BglG family transcription antiterminator n=1 Tax=Halocella sp. SP3-1 TaxID=2382161 RepID=UPI000F75FDF2|nr:PRD domain-containing protein [Halocella sp. SP3-1]AZO94402.1 PRD domain-containing protein [Halocella sp. SP3-1]